VHLACHHRRELETYLLKVKLLDPRAKAPVCSRPTEDLGYDLFSLEYTVLYPGKVANIRTGVAVEARYMGMPLGLLVRDRSSMAAKGIFTHGGVIDAGYRGEIVVLMSWLGCDIEGHYNIDKGDKIAQLVPVPVLTGGTTVVEELKEANRGEKGFGSSGR
jgi:dUTP pyrophosphatase